MKRLSKNRDLFEAAAGEAITVTVKAAKTPFQVTFSDLESGGQWTVVQAPTAATPIEKRTFTMPGAAREFFVIVYGFPTAGQADPAAKYQVSFSGAAGSTDGPVNVLPPGAGDILDLPYEFRLPNAPMSQFLTANLAAKVAGLARQPGNKE